VEQRGIEPLTSALRTRRSAKLSYCPTEKCDFTDRFTQCQVSLSVKNTPSIAFLPQYVSAHVSAENGANTMRRNGYVYHDKTENCWYARVTVIDGNGKRRNLKKRAKDKAEAKEILKTLTRQLEDEGSKIADFSKLTFNDLADFYARQYLKEAVYVDGRKVSGLRDVARPRELLKHFRKSFGRRKLREISYSDICQYRDERFKVQTHYKRTRTLASWNREAAVLRRILNVALQQDWIVKNPFNCGDPLIIISGERRREKILTFDEEARLLEACESHSYRHHLKSLLIFLIDTGCRKSEALKLRWKSICFESRVITIEGMTTKTLKTRHVVMTERIAQELATLWDESPKDHSAEVFGISSNVRKSFASVCKIAGIQHGGIDGLTLHSLRHTAATRLVQGGMSIQLAGRILGHSQVNTTYRYLSANMETAAQAAAILESFQAQPSRSVTAESMSSEMVN
jgi:integrase